VSGIAKYKTPTPEELERIQRVRPELGADDVAVFHLEGRLGVLVYKERGPEREFVLKQ